MLQVKKKTLNIRGRLFDLSTPQVMGILNVTPDSFFAESRARLTDQLLEKVGIMQSEGAAMIDIGGYSTRPGAALVAVGEESDRVVSALEKLTRYFPELIFSVDTFRSKVAENAVQAGAHIINDVAGGTLDSDMFDIVARLRVPYILMHMRGTPETMNGLTDYKDLVPDILKHLDERIAALRSKGVADIIADPGFGFAKTISQNFELMDRLNEFAALDCPVLVGISRKKTIYKTLDIKVEDALNGTTVLNTLALERGADILRVHDVKAAAEAIKLRCLTASIEN